MGRAETRALLLCISLVVGVSALMDFDADSDADYAAFFDGEVDFGDGEASWQRVDDEIEAREEEYYRRRRQILINRMKYEHETELAKKEDDACAARCTCQSRNEVHCMFKFMSKVPEALPRGTVKLNLGYNKLRVLPPKSFEKISTTLRFLFLHSNDIRSLNNNVFSKLDKVEVLRLSWNEISGIRKVALHGLHNVERLYLDNNRLSFIHPLALRGLTNLKLLQLDGNRLSRIHQDVFVTMEFDKYFKFSSIQYLYLSKNQFQQLPRRIFDHMTKLRRTYLHANEWDCSCDLKWLKEWMDTEQKYRCKSNSWNPRAGEECALCFWPPRLKGARLQDISPKNFTCEPPTIATKGSKDKESRIRLDQEDIRLQEEMIIFRYSDFYSTRMNIRLDSYKRSVFHANCNLTRVPDVKVEEISEKSINKTSSEPEREDDSETRWMYKGYFEAQMQCTVEYPEDFTALQEMLSPYLDRAINFTLRNTRPSTIGERQSEYSVSVSSLPAVTSIPLTGASISSRSDFMRSPSSVVTFHSSNIDPEGRRLNLAFQTSFIHTHTPRMGKYSKKPWALIKRTKGPAVGVAIAVERRTTTLKCKSVGQPRPKIIWVTPGEIALHPGDTYGRYSVSKSGRLFIRKTKPADSGLFHCIATVPETTKLKTVTFPSSADVEIGAIKLTVFPRTKESSGSLAGLPMRWVEEGGEWSSECNIQGVPNVTKGWITPSNQLISPEGKDRHGRIAATGKGKVIVKNFQKSDQGIYRCVAANGMGTAEYAIHVGMQNIDSELMMTVEEGPAPDPSKVGTKSNKDDSVIVPPIVQQPTTRTQQPTTATAPVSTSGSTTDRQVVISRVQETETPQTTQATLDHTTSGPQANHSLVLDIEEPQILDKAAVPVLIATDDDLEANDTQTVAEEGEVSSERVFGPQGEQATVRHQALPEPPTDSAEHLKTTESGLQTSPVIPEISEIITFSTITSTETHRKKERESQFFDVDEGELNPSATVKSSAPVSIFDFQQNPIITKPGATITIPCNANGNPMPELTWTARGNARPISAVPRATAFDGVGSPSLVFVTKAGHRQGHLVLVINGVTRAEAGTYTCTARNVAETATKDVEVIIAEPAPKEEEREELVLPETHAYCGEEFTVPCSLVSRSPSSIVHWSLPGGSRVPVSVVRDSGLTVHANGTLSIRNAQPQHSGVYKCDVQNPGDAPFVTAKVTVDCTAPRIIAPLDSILTVSYGTPVNVACEATGHPEPSIKWLSVKGSDPTSGKVLALKKVTENSTHQCFASNSAGNATFEFNIIARASKPRLLPELAASVSALEGLTAQLDCYADGIPAPSYVWFYPNGSVINFNQERGMLQQLNGSLVIDRVKQIQEGRYRCIAGNELGTDEMTVRLVVTRRYVPPTLDSGPTGDSSEAKADEFDLKDKNEHSDLPTSDPDLPPLSPKVSSPVYNSRFTKTQKPYLDTPTVERRERKQNPAAFLPDTTAADTATTADIVPTSASNNSKPRDTVPTVADMQTTGRQMKAQRPYVMTTRKVFLPSTDITQFRYHTSSPHDVILSSYQYVEPAASIYSPRSGRYRNERHRASDVPLELDGMNSVYSPSRRVSHEYFRSVLRAVHGRRTILPCKPSEARRSRGHWGSSQAATHFIWTFPSGMAYGRPYPVMPTNPRYFIFANGSLLIRSSTPNDAGIYECEASQADGKIDYESTTALSVESERPHIIERSRDYVRVKTGDSIALPCTTRGSPSPSLTWTTPEGSVLRIGSWRGSVTVLPNGTLLLPNIRPSESGRYTCKVANDAGQRRRIVQVQVASYPPRFHHPRTRRKHVRNGGSLELSCAATGSPPPTFYWTLPSNEKVFVNQAIFKGNLERPKYAVLSTGTLVLNRASTEDNGIYYCTAENPLGRDVSSMTLRVYK